MFRLGWACLARSGVSCLKYIKLASKEKNPFIGSRRPFISAVFPMRIGVNIELNQPILTGQADVGQVALLSRLS